MIRRVLIVSVVALAGCAQQPEQTYVLLAPDPYTIAAQRAAEEAERAAQAAEAEARHAEVLLEIAMLEGER